MSFLNERNNIFAYLVDNYVNDIPEEGENFFIFQNTDNLALQEKPNGKIWVECKITPGKRTRLLTGREGLGVILLNVYVPLLMGDSIGYYIVDKVSKVISDTYIESLYTETLSVLKTPTIENENFIIRTETIFRINQC